MFRALWYILKIIFVVGAAVFLIVQPGQIMIGWKDYKITIQLGYAAVTLLISFMVVAGLSGILTRLSLWPENFVRARSERRRTKGYRTLMQSLSAAATGDQKSAYYLAKQAQKFLPESESGLPLLLQAQAISQTDHIPVQSDPYEILLKNADTALLGIQGLTQNAILAGHFEKALFLARKAFSDNPKNLTLVKTIYDLEIKNRLWNDALVTLKKYPKILSDRDEQDRKVIYIILGDMAKDQGRPDESVAFYKKAYKADQRFVPATVRYIQSFIDSASRRKALSVLEKAWKAEAHPDYIPLWDALAPHQSAGKQDVKFRWFQRIADLQPKSEIAQLALARVAIEQHLWGEARLALVQAEKLGKSAEIYKLWVLLEEKTTQKPEVIRQWLDRAYHAGPSGAWVCLKTGRHFPTWHPIIEPENLFNTLVWTMDVDPKPVVSNYYPPISGVLTATS
ncbi:MAG: hypothetical protein JNL76_08710 [Alphaproteobacteria bacterium]|nr:hypothetical protein [Alphaproteobacteria bacterium]